jgi:hypothetical protein
MRWPLWRKAAPRTLSHQLKAAVMAQCPLDSQTVDTMRFYSRTGSFANRRAEYIRIFDPGLIEDCEDGELAATSYDAFALTDTRRSALLFEGHIQKFDDFDDNERVFLTDRRASKNCVSVLSINVG